VKESQIQRAILDYLAAERIPAWRMNTGAMSGSHKGKKWFVRFGEKGMADILCWLWSGFSGEGYVLWIEVKTATGKQSEDQKAFQKDVEENGMRYLLARSSDDVISWFKDFRR
jgi:hypothetical protein